jgi:soluble lytic murein transglycosylase-like protein
MSVIMTETHEKIVRKVRKRSRIIHGILTFLLVFSILWQVADNVRNEIIRESYHVVRQYLVDRQTRYLLLEILRNKPLTVGQALEIADVVIEESSSSKVPMSLALAIMSVESEFKPQAISSEGARGLMQVMPVVWKQYISSPDLQNQSSRHNAALNVRVGLRYIGDLWKQYRNWDKALKEYGGFINKDPRTYIRLVMEKSKRYRLELQE